MFKLSRDIQYFVEVKVMMVLATVRGAAARIKALYPLATYVHCSSHQLNLCVMKACSIQVRIATS